MAQNTYNWRTKPHWSDITHQLQEVFHPMSITDLYFMNLHDTKSASKFSRQPFFLSPDSQGIHATSQEPWPFAAWSPTRPATIPMRSGPCRRPTRRPGTPRRPRCRRSCWKVPKGCGGAKYLHLAQGTVIFHGFSMGFMRFLWFFHGFDGFYGLWWYITN